jgi:two-component system, cell cycle response regulator DivK
MHQHLGKPIGGSDDIFKRGTQSFGIPWSRSPVFAGVPKNPPAFFNDGSQNSLAKRVGKGRRILIIEDDPLSLELYDFLLQAFGFVTNLASNGEEGLAKAQSTKPDLILCDIRLPVLDGEEVMKRLKADPVLRHIPVIAVTIFSSSGHREHLLKAGFDGYMAKPTIPEIFIQQINKFLS